MKGLLANLLIMLGAWLIRLGTSLVLPKLKDEADFVAEITDPKQVEAAVSSPIHVATQKIGHIDFSLGNPPTVSRQIVAPEPTVSSYELKVADPFEDEITDAIVDALKDEQERSAGVRTREEETEE